MTTDDDPIYGPDLKTMGLDWGLLALWEAVRQGRVRLKSGVWPLLQYSCGMLE